MPPPVDVKSLKRLALESMADHIESWYNAYKDCGLESDMDARSARQLKMILLRSRRLTASYMKFLTLPGLTKIKFCLQSEFATDDYIDFLCERCHNLQRVDLALCDTVSPDRLAKIAKTSGSTLRRINFFATKANDDVLEAIADNCHHLFYLNIDSCSFTRAGLGKLFYADKPEGGKSLTRLGNSLRSFDISTSQFGAEYEFIAEVLRNFPKLQTVNHMHVTCAIIALLWAKPPLPSELALTFLTVDLDFIPSSAFPHFVQCLPHIDRLSITHRAGNETQVFHLLRMFGKKLRYLGLSWTFPLKFLSYVGKLCPNLEEMRVSFSNHDERENVRHLHKNHIFDDRQWSFWEACNAYSNYQPQYDEFLLEFENLNLDSDPDSCWCKLKKLEMRWFYIGDFTTDEPYIKPIFEPILSQSSLTSIDISDLPGNVEEFLLWAVRKGYFNDIERIYETHFGPDFESGMELLWELMLLPKLKYVWLSIDKDKVAEDLKKLKDYVRSNNLDVYLGGLEPRLYADEDVDENK